MTFTELFLEHVARAFDRQLALADQVGNCPWSFRMEEGTLSFSNSGPDTGEPRVSPVQLLGSEAEVIQQHRKPVNDGGFLGKFSGLLITRRLRRRFKVPFAGQVGPSPTSEEHCHVN